MIDADTGTGGSRAAAAAQTIDQDSFVTLDFELRYTCAHARHTERRHVPQVNIWRDILPPGLEAALIGKQVGDRIALRFDESALAPASRAHQIRDIRLADFDGGIIPGWPLVPAIGRYLPLGTLHRAGIGGIYRDNRKPFRVTMVEGGRLRADLNHPLAGVPIDLAATVAAVSAKAGDRGGRCRDWSEVLTDGPGMQCRAGSVPTEFFDGDWASRAAEGDDADFYANPRFVAHVDSRAIAHISRLYADFLGDGMRVLDLMTADRSHLPDHLCLRSVTGLGMNVSELAANPILTGRVVYDLNADPRLPFADEAFDAAMCTVSIEYLTRPVEVVSEVARVLAPGAPFVVTFSNRWFPPKVLKVWRAAHVYERLGYVLECFLRTGKFAGLETLVVRGEPRPADDPHVSETAESDPVFAVWGRRVH